MSVDGLSRWKAGNLPNRAEIMLRHFPGAPSQMGLSGVTTISIVYTESPLVNGSYGDDATPQPCSRHRTQQDQIPQLPVS